MLPTVSISNYERIVNNAMEQNRRVILAAYLEEPVQNMGIGDLILYVGSPKSLRGIDTYLLNNIKTLLSGNSLNAKTLGGQLVLFGEVVAKCQCVSSPTYHSTSLFVKMINGLNNYGIADYEIYKLVLESANKFFELIGEKGDY